MLFALAVSGCATAHKDSFTNGRPDGGVHISDSGNGGNQDTGGGSGMADAAPHLDSPTGPVTQTLSQSTSNTDDGSGIACGVAASGYTVKNSFYRVFTLSDYGVTGVFHVSGVDFVASGVTNSPPIRVSVGTYNGTVSSASLGGTITLAQSANINPSTGTNSIHVPLTADISGNLVIEIDQTTDGNTTNGYQFYPGANTAGETKPGYIMSTGCNVNTPTNITTAAGSTVNLIMSVTGST